MSHIAPNFVEQELEQLDSPCSSSDQTFLPSRGPSTRKGFG